MLPRLHNEIQALVTCPAESQPKAIDSILLRRFFGTSSSYIRKSYERPTSTLRASHPAQSAASKEVIGIPELLEAILSHLPFRSLIRATEVNTAFRNLTMTSPMLQKNLFLLAKKEPSETPSLASRGKSWTIKGSTKKYQIATLCPLLHMDSQSHRTMEQRFLFEDDEVVAINPCAANAGTFTNMFLTNPPCVRICVRIVYKGTASRKTSPDGKAGPAIHTTISATRRIRNETGVTFAMLMEATHVKGTVWVTMEDRSGKTDDEGTLGGGYVYCPGEYFVKDMTLHEQTRDWEEKCSSIMRLDTASTVVRLHGVIVHTAADFAAIEKADRDAKMEAEQRKVLQAVLLELKQKTSDKAGK